MPDRPQPIENMTDSDPTLIVHPHEGTPDPTDTPEDLNRAIKKLASSTMPVAIDVERASGFRYSDRAYLIQIRREDTGTFLIDADALPHLYSLGEALQNAVWILHAADQDLPSLRGANLHAPELFDTEVAAQLLGFERIGLAAVLEQTLGVTLDKEHQASDWSNRPLPRSWLRYAALDVEFLTQLYRALSRELYDAGRWDWAEQEFAHILSREPKPTDPNKWRSIPGAGKIRTRRQLAILQQLWRAREAIAKEQDIAPTRLINNRTLVSLAFKPPRNKRALLSIQEMRRPRTRNHTDEWIRAIRHAKCMSETDLPPLRKPVAPGTLPKVSGWRSAHPDELARLKTIRRAIEPLAKEIGIDPAVLLEPRVQKRLAWDGPVLRSDEMREYLRRRGAREWQIERVTGALVKATN